MWLQYIALVGSIGTLFIILIVLMNVESWISHEIRLDQLHLLENNIRWKNNINYTLGHL